MNIIDFKELNPLPKYDFIKNGEPKIKSMFPFIHVLQLMGRNIVGLEIGVYRGNNFAFILQQCQNIKTFYAIDSYQPYVDEFENESANNRQTEHSQNNNKSKFIERVRRTGFQNKAKLIVEDTSVAVDYFDDLSLDFIWIDSYLCEKDVYIELRRWYNKVKIGGLFAGHDYAYNRVKRQVDYFHKKCGTRSNLSTYGAEWAWIKDSIYNEADK